MAALANLSFETPGATPGSAAAWTVTVTSGAELVGDFDAAALPYEGFEGWDPAFAFAFVGAPPVGTDLAVPNFATLSVNPKHVEDFEELWLANQTSLFALDSPEQAKFGGPVLQHARSVGATIAIIPDNDPAGVVKTLTTAGLPDLDALPAEVGAVWMRIEVDHPYEDELVMTLSPPGVTGAHGNLWPFGTGGGPFEPTSYDITSVVGPLLDPVQKLNGNWSLKVADELANAISGTFAGWTLTVYGMPTGHESFEAGWSNDDYLFAWTDEGAQLDPFAGGVAEGFDGWPLGTFYFTWGAVTDAYAPFGDVAGTMSYEGFENVRPKRVFVVNPATDFFTMPTHGLANGMKVRIVGDGIAPAPLVLDHDMFVVNATVDTFQLSETSGSGDPIDITSSGSGDLAVQQDQTKFWTSLMSTI